MAAQTVATTQASSLSSDLDSAKGELASYMQAIEEDRRYLHELGDLLQKGLRNQLMKKGRITLLFDVFGVALRMDASVCSFELHTSVV